MKEIENENEKVDYGIEASSAAFEVLSNSLYQNPVLAVIRELSTNANDAHIEAGVSKPFTLHIPTREEPFFRIRDYGNGIPEDWIYNVYVKLFLSTKTEDEGQTGCFGLGSKTPYAIVDSYKVTSYCDGMRKEYLMEKVNKFPTVQKINERKMFDYEENGLEIYVKIPEREIYKFENEAREFFKGTQFLPDCNIDFYDDEYLQQRTFYTNTSALYNRERSSYYYYDFGVNNSVNVAGVRFPMLSGAMDKSVKEKIERMMQDSSIARMNILASKSDVSITPSREFLQYNEKTNNFLLEKVKEVIDKEYEHFENDFDNLSIEDLLFLRNSQTYNRVLCDRAEKKIENLFFEYKAKVETSSSGTRSVRVGRSWYYAPRINYYSSREKKEVFLVDFSGIESSTKQKVVDNFLDKTTIDGDKVTSVSFANVLKALSDSKNFVVYFIKDSSKKEECEKLLGVKAVMWKDLTVEKKDSGRRLGFKTRATVCLNNMNCFYGSNPDLKDGEIGVICPDTMFDNRDTSYLYNLRELLEAGKYFDKLSIFVRPCKESVYKKMKEKGFQDIKDFVIEFIENNKQIYSDKMEKVNKVFKLEQLGFYNFFSNLESIIKDKKYDELEENCEAFKFLRENYKKETFESVTYRDKNMCKDVSTYIKDVPNYKEISFDEFALYKYSAKNTEDSVKSTFDYVLDMIRYRKMLAEPGASEIIKSSSEKEETEEEMKEASAL